MSLIPPVNPETAAGQTAELLGAVKNAFGMVPNLFRVAAQSPAALDGLLKLNGALSGGVLTGKQREAIALAVAEANGCDYCLSAHSVIGKAQGLSQTDLSEARAVRSADPDTARLLGFAVELVRRAGRIDVAKVQALLDVGISAEQVVEVVAAVAFNTFTNYLNHVAVTEIDFPPVSAGHGG